ncbi:MAG: class I SAM-dependent methyltransferase [Pseudomonadota bacterium]
MKLTTTAHHAGQRHVSRGSVTIDATAGNGHDTLFLAQCVGPTGQVFAFDPQERAIASTQWRIDDAGVSERVTLLQASHATMADSLAAQCIGKVSVIMFNLGYLPGGDKTLTTQLESTLVALEACTPLLSETGVLSIMAYRGHTEGIAEFAGVSDWVNAQQGRFVVLDHQESPNAGPAWWLLSR